MKVSVNLNVASKTGATPCTFEVMVSPTDTVRAAKERIATAQLIAFPNQDLLLNGAVLDGAKTLGNSGVTEGSSLDFIVKPSQGCLVKQFTDLLKLRDLSCDELGLLYCYKHGASVADSLKTIGHKGKLVEFLQQEKGFLVENGRVSLVRGEPKSKPFSVCDEVARILKANSGSMQVTALCAKFVQEFNLSITSFTGMKPMEFLASEPDVFALTGRGAVALRSSLKAEQPTPAPPPGISSTEVDLSPPPGLASTATGLPADHTQYSNLLNAIAGRAFQTKAAQTLNDTLALITSVLFLNLDHIVKGGSVGKGTAISGLADAEVSFFVKGMPADLQEAWLPALLKSVSSVLSESADLDDVVESLRVSGDSLRLQVKGLDGLTLRFAPCSASPAEALASLAASHPEAWRSRDASLAEQRVQFIAGQPGEVKATIRLLKWWREQQAWSCALARPSDELLELVAVYSAVQAKPADQSAAVGNAMSLLARFDELRVVWSNYYGKEDVWAPLLKQTPLLMDPVNPFVNVADPEAFDARELMALAKSTRFFC